MLFTQDTDRIEELDEVKLVAAPATDLAGVRRELSLGIEERIDDLRRHDGAKRLFELVFFPGLFVTGALLTAYATLSLTGPTGTTATILAMATAVVGLNAMVLLVHEGMHGVLLPGRRANRWVSMLLASPLLIAFSAYRVLHLRHHRYLGDPRDPDDYHNYTRSPLLVWALHYNRLLFGSFLYLLLIPILALRHGARKERRDVCIEYACLLALWTSTFILLPWPLLWRVWLVPALATGLLVNLRGFCQHGLAEARDPFLASRSILTHRALAFCLLHENLHLEHHLFPDVPSYNLPGLRRLVVDRYPRQTTASSYTGVLARFFLQSLRLDESPVGRVEGHARGGGPS